MVVLHLWVGAEEAESILKSVRLEAIMEVALGVRTYPMEETWQP